MFSALFFKLPHYLSLSLHHLELFLFFGMHFFARILLGDVFSPYMIIGTIIIAGGAVLIGIFGIVPEPTHSLEDLLKLLQRPTFIVYFSLLSLTVIVGLVIVSTYKNSSPITLLNLQVCRHMWSITPCYVNWD